VADKTHCFACFRGSIGCWFGGPKKLLRNDERFEELTLWEDDKPDLPVVWDFLKEEASLSEYTTDDS
jgi:hypothetical protein